MKLQEHFLKKISGQVKLEIKETKGGILVPVSGGFEFKKNIIVLDASLLLAELCKNYNVPGVTHLAVGLGSPAWDPMNPPAPTVIQNTLYREIDRRAHTSTSYMDSGVPVLYRTNTVQFVTEFPAGRGTGALCEIGLFGGTDANLANLGTMFNFFTFPVINKLSTQSFTWTWLVEF